MTNVMTASVPTVDRFRVVQLLPAPVTVLALALAATHDPDAAPLGVIAAVGAVATLGSALLPSIRPAFLRRTPPAPREEDRVHD